MEDLNAPSPHLKSLAKQDKTANDVKIQMIEGMPGFQRRTSLLKADEFIGSERDTTDQPATDTFSPAGNHYFNLNLPVTPEG